MRRIAWSASDVGSKRDHNEDSLLADDTLGLFAVADGMGGHQGGAKASSMAVEILRREVTASFGQPGAGPVREGCEAALRNAAQVACRMIFEEARTDRHLRGMGTTLTAMLFSEGRAYLAHVGDSRAFRYRDGHIEQLTQDHSWIAEQVRAGVLTEAEARESRFKHIITRSVGFERDVEIDFLSLPALLGDCFLLATDGMSNYIEADELAKIMSATAYSRVPQVLVDIANDRGGDDNITVVLVCLANDEA